MDLAARDCRRIVTGVGADGRSRIVADGPCPAVTTAPSRPGYRVHNMWRTLGVDQPSGAPDTILEHKGISPPPNGSILRVIDFPPETGDPEERRRAHEAQFRTMWADAGYKGEHARHPGMHITQSVDYAIMLEGELVAIMDEGETVMRAGDILVQRGTSHAWANRSNRMARIAFVLIHAAP